VETVFRDFFGRVLADFDDWRTVMNEVHDAGDRVLALGTYSGRAKTTGKTFVARFSHCWTVESGTMVRLQQCADTAQISRALEA
jgi:ketosteroid isomerase-like protein